MEVDDIVTFCQTDLRSTSFAAFEDMRKKEELCDFKIIVQNKEITAHRVVVAAGIPYFRSTFASDKDEEITLSDIDFRTLESLIDFAYSSRIEISNKNAKHILFASKVLRLDMVLEACVEFLSKRIDVNNVWQIHSLAVSLDIAHLIEMSNHYILANMAELAKSVEFSNLRESHLIEIVSKNDLNASSEKVIFDAIIDWVKVSPSERQAALPQLMNQIRLVYLPIEYLSKRAASEEIIKTSPICRDMIDEVKNYHLFPNDELMFPNVKTNPRQFSGLYGICKKGSTISISYCDFVKQMWHRVSNSGKCHLVFHPAAVGENLYMFCEKQTNIFNTKTLEWRVVFQQWNEDMLGAAFATIGNVIYGFGGDAEFRNTVWCFDTDKNKWHQKGETKRLRRYSAATSVELLTDTSCIYVTGGIFYSKTVEKYSPSTNQCTEVTPMLRARCGHCGVSMNGKIYVCGGISVLGSSEMYDPVVDKWTLISTVNTKSVVFPLVVYNNKLYALVDNDTYTRRIEIYYPDINKWESSFSTSERFTELVAI